MKKAVKEIAVEQLIGAEVWSKLEPSRRGFIQKIVKTDLIAGMSEEARVKCIREFALMGLYSQVEVQEKTKWAVKNRFKVVSVDNFNKTVAQFASRKEAEAQIKNYALPSGFTVIEFAGQLPEDR